MGHQITVTLSDSVYEALCRQAKAQKKSVRTVAEEALRAATLSKEATSLHSAQALSSPLEVELHALAEKSDEELWRIAESRLPPARLRRWRRLINKHEAGDALTPDEERELDILVEEGERLTTLKSEAYVLLKWRGHRLPTLEELREHRRRR